MSQNYMIPGAIVIAGGLIAAGVLFGGSGGGTQATGNTTGSSHTAGGGAQLAPERTENAYIQGDPSAPIKFVEFSDFECPFCARLHPTLSRLIDEADGQIAWEYRHLPLPSHRNAEEAAYAGECIGRLGGNEAFWDYADAAFANQRAFGSEFYNEQARQLGIDEADFSACFGSDEVKEIVEADLAVAVSHGGRGTPFSVIVFPDGSTQPVSGALPYENWAQLLTHTN